MTILLRFPLDRDLRWAHRKLIEMIFAIRRKLKVISFDCLLIMHSCEFQMVCSIWKQNFQRWIVTSLEKMNHRIAENFLLSFCRTKFYLPQRMQLISKLQSFVLQHGIHEPALFQKWGGSSQAKFSAL